MRRNIELQVGLLVVFAMIATTFWLLFLKEFKFQIATWPVHVNFPETAGITEGAPVYVLGVKKGDVGKIELERNGVVLTLEIEEGVELSKDALFFVQPDLMGPTYVNVRQGTSSETLSEGARVSGVAHAELGALLEDTAQLLARLDIMGERLGALIAGEGMDSIMIDLGSGARDLRFLAGEGRLRLPKALADLEGLSQELRDFVGSGQGFLTRGEESLLPLIGRFDSLLIDLNAAGPGIRSLGRSLESGEGTLGRLLNEEDVYQDIKMTLQSVDSLIQDIRAHPTKYFKLEIF
ncbi:MAG: MlaD family protein [Candidatus Krumholzibacteria bacterium]|nr:MlaD family protein [Candidatus Krumholzibacteria bacterium]MDP6669517.1 MlaD family protein [Candidatus Krumholzibacteria bacterium]MDP6797839.1 MlaD family protein [Candidatus Krumholzibacteria bacterium]MDP7022517.1 MlaD family protein [Candidatus Krumholzibacteria bacterium]